MIKKTVFMLLLSASLLSCTAYAATDIDFQNDAVSSFPAGWAKTLGGDDSYAQIVEEEENKFLKFNSNNSSSTLEYYFEPMEGRFILEVDLKYDRQDESTKSKMRFALRTYAESSAIFNYINDSGNYVQEHYPGFGANSTIFEGMKYGQWYNIKYDIDVPAKTYNVYVNDVKVKEAEIFRKQSSTDLATLQFTSAISEEKSVSVSIDNLKIYPLESQMTLTIGSNTALFNDKTITMDAAPFIVNDRSMVPLRLISENFGAEVSYHADTKSIGISYQENVIWHTIGADEFRINGTLKTVDTPSMLVDDRTFVPFRAIVEIFGYDVDWNANTITIRKGE